MFVWSDRELYRLQWELYRLVLTKQEETHFQKQIRKQK